MAQDGEVPEGRDPQDDCGDAEDGVREGCWPRASAAARRTRSTSCSPASPSASCPRSSSVPYEQLVSHYEDYPSAVGYFRSHGHTPVAIHPFSPRMYARTQGVRDLRLREVHHQGRHEVQGSRGRALHRRRVGVQRGAPPDRHPRRARARAPDHHAEPHAVRRAVRRPDQPDRACRPSTPSWPASTPVASPAATTRSPSMFAKLKKSPEPTAVIFYGDHLPPQVYPQSLVEREGPLTAHQTPFLIWSNRKPLPHTEAADDQPDPVHAEAVQRARGADPAVVRAARRPRQGDPGDGQRDHGQPAGQAGQALAAHPGGEEGARRLPDDHVRPEHRRSATARRRCSGTRPSRSPRRSRGTAAGCAPAAASPSGSSGCPSGARQLPFGSSTTSASSFAPVGGTNSGSRRRPPPR